MTSSTLLILIAALGSARPLPERKEPAKDATAIPETTQARAPEAPSRVNRALLEEVRQIGRRVIAWDDTTRLVEDEGNSAGHHLVPNELNYRTIAPVIREMSESGLAARSMAVVIGTQRGLFDAAQGGFARTIQLDYDRRATGFNRANLDLIATSANREEWAARVQGQTYRSADDRRPATEDLVVRALNDTSYSASNRFGRYLPMRNQLAILRHQQVHWQATPFGSDALFASLKQQVEEKRIVPLNGDLGGLQAMRSIAKASQKLPIGLIDFSNALHYVSMQPGGNQELLSALRDMKFADNAKIVFTMRFHQNYFWYFSAEPKDVIKAIEDDVFSGEDFMAFRAEAGLPLSVDSPQTHPSRFPNPYTSLTSSFWSRLGARIQRQRQFRAAMTARGLSPNQIAMMLWRAEGR